MSKNDNPKTVAEARATIQTLEAEVERLKNPAWPKAAPGCGVLLHYTDADGQPFILYSERGTEHGKGYGITGGGFFSVKKALPYPKDYIKSAVHNVVLTHEQEAFRELCEEFRDQGQDENENDTFEEVQGKATAFVNILTFSRFFHLSERICGFVVRTPHDPHNQYHDCNFFSCEVSEGEAQALLAIPGNAERPKTVALPANKASMEHVIERLFHAHEAEPIKLLAQYLIAKQQLSDAGIL